MTNKLLSEVLATLAGIAPSAQAAGAVNTAAILLDTARRALFTVLVGTPGGGGTVNFKLQASVTGAGSWVDIPNAAIAQLAAAGIAQVEVRADRLAALGLGSYIRGVLTVGTATTPTAVVAQLGDSRYQPASDNNDASVATPVLV